MRKYLCFILLSLVLLMSGCKSNSTQAGIDKTVKNIETFNEEDYTVAMNATGVGDFSDVYHNISELYKDAKNIVYGTVKTTTNYDNSGTAHTLYTFAVEKVYKGDLNKNDTISAMCLGGYSRVKKQIELFGDVRYKDFNKKQRETSVIQESFMGAPIPKQEDNLLLFLGDPSKDFEPFPDGVYFEAGTFMGRFYYSGNKLVRYTPTDEPNFYNKSSKTYREESYTLNELERLINDCKKGG